MPPGGIRFCITMMGSDRKALLPATFHHLESGDSLPVKTLKLTEGIQSVRTSETRTISLQPSEVIIGPGLHRAAGKTCRNRKNWRTRSRSRQERAEWPDWKCEVCF